MFMPINSSDCAYRTYPRISKSVSVFEVIDLCKNVLI